MKETLYPIYTSILAIVLLTVFIRIILLSRRNIFDYVIVVMLALTFVFMLLNTISLFRN